MNSSMLSDILLLFMHGIHACLANLAVAGSQIDAWVCVETKVSDRPHLSALPTCTRLWLLSPEFEEFTLGALGIALQMRDGLVPLGSASLKRLVMNSVWLEYAADKTIFIFMHYWVTQVLIDGSLYDCIFNQLTLLVTTRLFMQLVMLTLILWSCRSLSFLLMAVGVVILTFAISQNVDRSFVLPLILLVTDLILRWA